MDIHPLTNHDTAASAWRRDFSGPRKDNEKRGSRGAADEPRAQRRSVPPPPPSQPAPRSRPRWSWPAVFRHRARSRRPTTRVPGGPRGRPRSWSPTTENPAALRCRAASPLPELDAIVRSFGALRLAAYEVGDAPDTPRVAKNSAREAWLTFHRLLERYVRARNQVRDGVGIDAAACRGSGGAMPGKRFKHLRCAVTSAVLEIPQVEVVYGDQQLPTAIQGPPRYRPLEAEPDVHVTGKTSIAYRQVADDMNRLVTSLLLPRRSSQPFLFRPAPPLPATPDQQLVAGLEQARVRLARRSRASPSPAGSPRGCAAPAGPPPRGRRARVAGDAGGASRFGAQAASAFIALTSAALDRAPASRWSRTSRPSPSTATSGTSRSSRTTRACRRRWVRTSRRWAIGVADRQTANVGERGEPPRLHRAGLPITRSEPAVISDPVGNFTSGSASLSWA